MEELSGWRKERGWAGVRDLVRAHNDDGNEKRIIWDRKKGVEKG